MWQSASRRALVATLPQVVDPDVAQSLEWGRGDKSTVRPNVFAVISSRGKRAVTGYNSLVHRSLLGQNFIVDASAAELYFSYKSF